ncbi:hypothetical protein BO83DRAFT_390421 [Aspergillus eucalypticola CBS 122712]|uniref:Uncharacterized protein n=1 Tax=Aspergillus eucalypticola (strain CBS 122712 / IBT 29274) TaxID=1448314 RepID=A0A317V7J1_ASPEC|nr:uncharacterized protein BO83DRAFT_390421 [Aspergillus eucalypticola CBS 122712]PWY69399.1 hypothetical protein BO83DRAFT_390421 [Aspergillus eucalypticola CBS 122712]
MSASSCVPFLTNETPDRFPVKKASFRVRETDVAAINTTSKASGLWMGNPFDIEKRQYIKAHDTQPKDIFQQSICATNSKVATRSTSNETVYPLRVMHVLIDDLAAHVPEDACNVISETGEFASSTSGSIPFMPVTSLTLMITCAWGSNANLFLNSQRDRVQMFMKNVVVKNLRHEI